MWIVLILSMIFYPVCVHGEKWSRSYFPHFTPYNVECECDRPQYDDASLVNVRYYNFHSGSNDSYPISASAEEILQRKDFDPYQIIRFYVPDIFHSTIENALCVLSADDYEGKKPLVLVIEYLMYANINTHDTESKEDSYQYVVKHYKAIGEKLSNLMSAIISKVDRELVDVLAHGIGAHIAGWAGETLRSKTYLGLKRILAADPAGICFENCPKDHLKSGQADLVIAFHCNAGGFGSRMNLADNDFYSHSGEIQLNCDDRVSFDSLAYDVKDTCSHETCVSLVGEFATQKHKVHWKAVKCPSAEAYLDGECDQNQQVVISIVIDTKQPLHYYGLFNEPYKRNVVKNIYYFTPFYKLTCGRNIYDRFSITNKNILQ